MSFFFSPSGYLRSFTLFLGEFIKELTQARRTRRSGIRPQMHRGLKYAGMRAASNVLLRDVNTSLIIEEMYRGTNVIYADFTDYDELAHHCGPERVESFEALDGVDRAIATLIKATDDAPRPYKFIVLSDHGQSLGETFLQRYGAASARYVREPDGRPGDDRPDQDQGRGVDVRQRVPVGDHPRARASARPSLGRRSRARPTPTASSTSTTTRRSRRPRTQSTIAVVGSGNLGLVWFTGHDHRLTVEELEELHPGLVAAVAAHPGVGLLLVRSKEFGAVVFGPKGTRFLDEDKVEGEDPTTLFGPHTIMSLKREDAMVHAPDLLLLSQYDPELGEVAAFEELIGSHGGLGGSADRAVHPPPDRVDARRGGAAGRAGDLPQHPALAVLDRDRAGEASPLRAWSPWSLRRHREPATGRRNQRRSAHRRPRRPAGRRTVECVADSPCPADYDCGLHRLDWHKVGAWIRPRTHRRRPSPSGMSRAG